METTTELSDRTPGDLPHQPAAEPPRKCIGCGVEVADGETPPCGH